MSANRFLYLFLFFVLLSFLIFGGVVYIVDPFFHYHKPYSIFQYDLQGEKERYQNDGIGKNWDYDAIITGTSMTQNFKTSQFDKLFDVSSVKLPFSGASWKEINENLARVLKRKSPKIIVRGLDSNQILNDKDWQRHKNYPLHLYNDFIFDDVKYLINKYVLLNNVLSCIIYTRNGNKTTSFDVYNNWNSGYVFGAESVWLSYKDGRKNDTLPMKDFSEDDKIVVSDNVNQNVLELVASYTEVQFYYFFTPYSILWWDGENQNGTMLQKIKGWEYACELLLKYENLHLFSFFDSYETICNLDNYKDAGHYGEWINEWMLDCMRKDEHRLSLENYKMHWADVYDFYSNYDYVSLINFLGTEYK